MTYYQILGLNKKCSSNDVKTAFRNLSKKYHPDINKSNDASNKFIQIYTAYEILIDPSKRDLYDKTLKNYDIVLSKAVDKQKGQRTSFTEKEKSQFQKYETEASIKAKHYAKESFEKFAKDIFNAVDKAYTVFSFLAGAFFGLFLLGIAIYGIILFIGAFGKVERFEWWRPILLILFVFLLGWSGVRIFKYCVKEMNNL